MYLDISSLLTPPSVAYDPSGATFCTTNGIKAELVRHFVFSQYQNPEYIFCFSHMKSEVWAPGTATPDTTASKVDTPAMAIFSAPSACWVTHPPLHRLILGVILRSIVINRAHDGSIDRVGALVNIIFKIARKMVFTLSQESFGSH